MRTAKLFRLGFTVLVGPTVTVKGPCKFAWTRQVCAGRGPAVSNTLTSLKVIG
jgi:hypothetical protein